MKQELTYCLNIHPTETWEEVRAALLGPVLQVRDGIAGDGDFPVGLRFSGQALHDLRATEAREDLKTILKRERLRAVTVNGFPYGRFHGTRVKEDVYRPDWREEERLAYTCELADLMAEIAPTEPLVSLSTVPGCLRTLSEGQEGAVADNYLRAVAHMVDLERRTGVRVALAIEPEPACMFETIEETAAFFRDHLLSDSAAERLAAMTDLERDAARAALPRYIGLCYDVCHAAVEFEDPAGSLEMLRRAGVPVHKLQLSAALRVAEVTPQTREALSSFAEPTYLHQVVSRRGDGPLERLTDLPEALARGAEADGEEWRVHFHVPIFLKDLGAFESTRDFLDEVLRLHRQQPISPHLEVETYSWNVLPERLRSERMEEAVLRELRWVSERLA
ncbi:MAG: metabolite traffic protein EboE [Limimaricola soesokkakensis]|uniref:metabolite traffic protein EboE n=1 Tax=Limimaricola soesokkakensis TaxID=1343159 RepID=UPI0040591A4C